MATSSFSKTFIFSLAEERKIKAIQKTSNFKVPSRDIDRIKEGQEALKRFSPRSKK